MKPLLSKDLDSFFKRFDNFRDGEFRSLEIISPTQINVTFAGQDNARAFDWITVKLEFSGVVDAQLLEGTKLSFVDMSEGISVINEDNQFAFGIGDRYNTSSIKNSTCYIIGSDLKYQEGSF